MRKIVFMMSVFLDGYFEGPAVGRDAQLPARGGAALRQRRRPAPLRTPRPVITGGGARQDKSETPLTSMITGFCSQHGGCRMALCLPVSTHNSRPEHAWMSGLDEWIADGTYLTSRLTNPV